MKKSIIAALAAAILLPAASVMAGSDYIEVLELFNRRSRLYLEDVDNFTVCKTQGITDGYNTLQVNYKNGESQQWLMGAIKEMNYIKGYEPSDLTFEIEPHHRAVSFSVKSSNPDAHWQVGALPVEYFTGRSKHEWHDIVYDYEYQLILEFLSGGENRKPENYKSEDFFYYQGDGKTDWFPATTEEWLAMPGSDYVAYVYQAEWIDGKPVFDHDVVFIPFTAKEIVQSDVAYDIKVTTTCKSITADVTSPDQDPFTIFIVPASEFDPSSADAFAEGQISALEYMLYSYGTGDWSSVTFTGKGSSTQKPVCPGDEYYVVAAGCEYGVMTSHAVYSEKVTIPYPEVTDDCTFSVKFDAINAMEADLTVTPSNDDTNYVVFMAEEGAVADPWTYYTRLLFTKYQYGFINTTPGEQNPNVFAGEATLNSLTNVSDSKRMAAGTKYIFYVFGIDELATPTTKIQQFEYTPVESTQKMSLSFKFDIDKYLEDLPNSPYYRYLWCDVTPSDETAPYVFDKYSISDSNLSLSDEDLVKRYVDDQYGYLHTQTGTKRHYTACSQFDPDAPYYIISFGYDGGLTSDLWLWKFNPATGELTQLRGPCAE